MSDHKCHVCGEPVRDEAFEKWIAQPDNEHLASGFEITYHDLHRTWRAATEVARAPFCEVCFTSSWQPCEETFPNAIKDPNGNGWMMCGYCLLENSLRKATEAERERVIAAIANDRCFMCRDGYGGVYQKTVILDKTFGQTGKYQWRHPAIKSGYKSNRCNVSWLWDLVATLKERETA